MIPSKPHLLIAVTFCAGVLLVPWLFGGNLPFVRSVALALIGLFLAIKLLSPSNWIGTPTKLEFAAMLLMLLGIGWSILQLVPFSGETISEYVPATRRRLAVLVLAISTFFVASNLFRNQALIPWVMAAIAFNGVLLTFFGLAQSVSDTDKLFWSVELIHGGQPFGPFVNGNNAGGYLIMCFASANFFLAMRFYRALHRSQSEQVMDDRTVSEKLLHGIGESFARTDPQSLYVIAGIAVTAAGVAASLSRGAMVALAVAIVVGWSMLFRRNIASAAVSVLIIGCGIGLLLWTQQGDEIASNISSLTKLEKAAPNRISHWQDSFTYATSYMPFGSGLGTYNIMYQPFQDTTFNRWFKYAENQYLETFAELGVPGITLLLGVLATGLIACIRLMGQPDSTSKAIGLSGLICVVGQSVAAFFDFGWFIPANMILFATMMGIVFGQLNFGRSASLVANHGRPKKPLMMARVFSLILLLLSGWATYEYSAVDCREACRKFYERFEPLRDNDKISFYQQLAEHSVKVRPDDARAHYQLALNYTLQYRWAASELMYDEVIQAQEDYINEVKASDPEAVPDEQPEFTLQTAWERSALLALHRTAWAAKRENPMILEQIRNSEPVVDYLRPAWNELKLAHESLENLWFIEIALAQLCVLMDQEDIEQPLIENAIKDSLDSSKVLYIAGSLYQHAGHSEAAYQAWNQCLQQTRDFDVPIFQTCRMEVPLKPFFEEVLPNDPFYRLWVAKKFFGSDADALLKTLLLQHTKAKIQNKNLPEAEFNYVLGEIEYLTGDYPAAISHLELALKLEKHQVKWRIQLARALIAVKLYEQAITELNICEFYQGDHQMACQRLLRQAKKLRMNSYKG